MRGRTRDYNLNFKNFQVLKIRKKFEIFLKKWYNINRIRKEYKNEILAQRRLPW